MTTDQGLLARVSAAQRCLWLLCSFEFLGYNCHRRLLVINTTDHACLQSSIFFSAVAPKTFWFCRKRTGSLPFKHASLPMGRFMRIGRTPELREASQDHDAGTESGNAGRLTQNTNLVTVRVTATMPRAKLRLSPFVKNSPSSL